MAESEYFDGKKFPAVRTIVDDAGASLGVTQQEAEADVAAPTAYSAHASGTTGVVSNAATDLDTTAAALATLVTEVTAIENKLNALLAKLRTYGVIAT